jgi:hypothetical protein
VPPAAEAAGVRLLVPDVAAPEVQAVIAHTQAQPGPSTRVLEKTGFVHDGEAADEEEGRVWRWSPDRPAG